MTQQLKPRQKRARRKRWIKAKKEAAKIARAVSKPIPGDKAGKSQSAAEPSQSTV